MNRDDFEKAYADKYTAGDVMVVYSNRDGEGYTDHHIDLCWHIQKIKNISVGYAMIREINRIQW